MSRLFAHSAVAVTALLLVACGDVRKDAMKTVKHVGEENLRKDAALYYKNIFAEHRLSFATVHPDYWPSSFRELKPHRIVAYQDGFAFTLERAGDAESGLYIVPLHMEHAPAPTAWASFERLSEGIYWYSFKP